MLLYFYFIIDVYIVDFSFIDILQTIGIYQYFKANFIFPKKI